MPEKNEEMSLRDALISAVTADPAAAEAQNPAEEAEMAAVETAETESVPGEAPADPVSETAEAAPAAEQSVSAPTSAPAPESGPSMAEMLQAFQALVAENQQLRQQVSQQGAAMQQQSQAAEGAIIGQFTPEAAVPAPAVPEQAAPPVLDMAEISYLDPAQQQQSIMKWQQEVMDYAVRSATARIREEVMSELSPVREDYEAKRRIAADDAARATLFAMPQFADMKGKEGDLDKIIASTPLLGGADPEQKFLLAALISRGMKTPHELTTEELIEKATANPDVMRAIESRRMAEIDNNNKTLPKVVPSSGIGNANAVPEHKPKTMDEIRDRMYKALGIR